MGDRAEDEREYDADAAAEWRGGIAWNMQLVDVRLGHDALGFDYPMNGDFRPTIRS